MAILIDTDVLIWYTRGHPGAKSRLSLIHPWRISVITYLELAQGCRSKDELVQLKGSLAARDAQVLPLSSAISDRSISLIDAHALSNGLRLADALIAATTLEYDLTLLTANTKHFVVIQGLDVEPFLPACPA
jgi:predicted nucleic acid-binding protein